MFMPSAWLMAARVSSLHSLCTNPSLLGNIAAFHRSQSFRGDVPALTRQHQYVGGYSARFVARFAARRLALGLLVCNAGIMGGPRCTTIDGLEMQFQAGRCPRCSGSISTCISAQCRVTYSCKPAGVTMFLLPQVSVRDMQGNYLGHWLLATELLALQDLQRQERNQTVLRQRRNSASDSNQLDR